MSDLEKARRSLFYGKIREGWDRIARERPEIDWTLDTPETEVAEESLCLIKERYETGDATLAEVKASFSVWEQAQINKNNMRELFT